MNKYDELVERKITKIIEESTRSKSNANFRPLQPKAKVVSLEKGYAHGGLEQLQGE